ncbi:MAG TPA: hypothetical protein VEX38_07805 [Fimbriimonadaceae bacterium]|nr:hypothetical protein [Fimbriimonadaceae bacterium]
MMSTEELLTPPSDSLRAELTYEGFRYSVPPIVEGRGVYVLASVISAMVLIPILWAASYSDNNRDIEIPSLATVAYLIFFFSALAATPALFGMAHFVGGTQGFSRYFSLFGVEFLRKEIPIEEMKSIHTNESYIVIFTKSGKKLRYRHSQPYEEDWRWLGQALQWAIFRKV